MVEAIGNKAIAGGRDSVAPFRELRQTVESAEAENKRGTLDVGQINLDLLKFISEVKVERSEVGLTAATAGETEYSSPLSTL